jgi:ubiquinone/menaquinone biosynthesis C-methylase UbiE
VDWVDQVKAETPARSAQKKFDFSPPRPRPFLANLPAKIDTYEEGVARFFRWRTGLDYYLAIDQIVDFVVDTKRMKVIDLLTDTATFALRLAGRKAFVGRIYSFDTNVTLLERAKQRAIHLNLQSAIEFRQFHEPRLPVPDGYGEIAVSIFDMHRHPVEQFLAEALRILAPDGHLIVAEMLEPKSGRSNWSWTWKKLHLRYVQKNPAEARAIYYGQEEIIALFFGSGFRQVIIQGLSVPKSRHSGIFSLIAATK